ncbi:MAG: MFS family permease [Rickettsiales bacterium]|jgi:MFS family permease
MFSTINSILSLLISFAILSVGHGLNTNLLNIRSLLENYSEITIGIMNSFYFLGFIIGVKIGSKYIDRVGPVRTFAGLISIISTISLLHALIIHPVMWIILRLVYGICIAGAYVVIESWLNSLSEKENRGRILSIYMIVNFSGLFLGQILINQELVETFTLFAVVSILASIAIVPLILSKVKQPEAQSQTSLSIKKLYKNSPLSIIGIVANAISASAFWSFGAIFMLKMGFTVENAAFFFAVTLIGGLFFQWPIGYISDKFNRRISIIICSITTILTSLVMLILTHTLTIEFNYLILFVALIFGGFSYPLYSLFISLANDFLKSGSFVKASSSLLMINGVGSVFGPLLAAIFIFTFDATGLFWLIIIANLMIFVIALNELLCGKKIPEATSDHFIISPKQTSVLLNMDPRSEE